MPHPRKWAGDNVEDTYTSHEEWGVVISDVTVDGLVACPLSEE